MSDPTLASDIRKMVDQIATLTAQLREAQEKIDQTRQALSALEELAWERGPRDGQSAREFLKEFMEDADSERESLEAANAALRNELRLARIPTVRHSDEAWRKQVAALTLEVERLKESEHQLQWRSDEYDAVVEELCGLSDNELFPGFVKQACSAFGKVSTIAESLRLANLKIEKLKPNREDFRLTAEDLDRIVNEAGSVNDLSDCVKDLLLAHYMYGDLKEQLATAQGRNAELVQALTNLANESSGFLGMADIARHGQTNSRVLQLRIEMARAEIAKSALREGQ